MRKRLRDWPQRVYKFRIFPDLEHMPQELWDVCHQQKDLWNKLVEAHEAGRASAKFIHAQVDEGTLTKEEGKAVLSALWASFEANAYAWVKESDLDWVNGPDTYDRFKTTVAMAPKRRGKNKIPGWPKIRHGIRRVALATRYTGGGATLAQLSSPQAKRFRVDSTLAGNHRGQIRINNTMIHFTMKAHRDIPLGAIVKRVTLIGERSSFVFDWQWYVAITVEYQQPTEREPTNRVCGIDLGWRRMGDHIRVATIVDNDGNQIELRLPLEFSTSTIRRHNARFNDTDRIPESYEDLRTLQRELDLSKDSMKAKIKEALDGNLPPGFATMGRRGLRNIELTGDLEIERNEWLHQDWLRQRRLSGAWARLTGRRKWLYANVAAWLTKRYDTICIEGDLDIKGMIEEEDKAHALKAADRLHQYASPYNFKLLLIQLAGKNNCHIIKGETQRTTSTCRLCGGVVEPDADRVLVCSEGHQQDQDVNAACNLLSQLPGIDASNLLLKTETKEQMYQWLNVPKHIERVLDVIPVPEMSAS